MVILTAEVWVLDPRRRLIDGHDADSSALSSTQVTYYCELLDSSGAACRQRFHSVTSLRAHQKTRTIGGEPGIPSIASLVVDTRCPRCLSRFSGRPAAVQHFMSAIKRGYCAIDLAYSPAPSLLTDDVIHCPICEQVFENVMQYYTHIRSLQQTDSHSMYPMQGNACRPWVHL